MKSIAWDLNPGQGLLCGLGAVASFPCCPGCILRTTGNEESEATRDTHSGCVSFREPSSTSVPRCRLLATPVVQNLEHTLCPAHVSTVPASTMPFLPPPNTVPGALRCLVNYSHRVGGERPGSWGAERLGTSLSLTPHQEAPLHFKHLPIVLGIF